MAMEYGPETCLVQGEVKPLGQVLLYDDMEGVLKWERVDSLNDGEPALYTQHAYQGTYGVRIWASVDEPNGWNWGYAGRSVGMQGHKRVRASLVFRSPWLGVAEGMRLWVRYYDGRYRWQGSYQYNFGATDRVWHGLSLEVDFEKGVYGQGLLDGVDLGITGNTLARVLRIEPTVLYVIVGVGSDSFRPKEIGFDLVLVQEV